MKRRADDGGRWVKGLVVLVSVLGCTSSAAPRRDEVINVLPQPPSQPLAQTGRAELAVHSVIVNEAGEGRASCPTGMLLVTGRYCPDVEHRCLRWLDPPGKYQTFRCAEYQRPAVCRAPRRTMSFCIDADEGGASTEDLRPAHHMSYQRAAEVCAARGARLCTQSEWQFACEGEEMRPYPYGFTRDSSACNIDRDRSELGRPGAGLHDLRSAVGEHPRCASPFGVRDLAGNLEEWVTRDVGAGGKATLLKGSWWLPGRSTCRATNAGHDAVYQGPETGFRCCSDPQR